MTSIRAVEPLDERLDALLAGRGEALAEPFALYRELRERGRAHVHGHVVLVTHYEDVKLAVRDAERFSNLALVAGPRIDEARTQMAEERARRVRRRDGVLRQLPEPGRRGPAPPPPHGGTPRVHARPDRRDGAANPGAPRPPPGAASHR